MCLDIVGGNFKSAFYDNPFLFIFSPVWAILILVRIIFSPKCLEQGGKLYNFSIYFSLISLLIFGVLRNILK